MDTVKPVVIDVTDEGTLAASVRDLDAGVRYLIMRALIDAQSADNATTLRDQLRDTLTEEYPGREAVAVLFRTTQYDNGYFLNNMSANVLFTDGTIAEVDFDANVEETLTDEFGIRGPEYSMVVNLATADIDEEDTSWGTTAERFAAVTPPLPTTPATITTEGVATA